MSDIIRIANCSGYYGDRLEAAREVLDGGPVDVLTGDYLAELTMSILHRQRQSRGENLGYVGTFLKQLRDVASICADRNIKIVTNAGGLNPQGMATEVKRILKEIGVDLSVAWIEGDQVPVTELQAAGETFKNMDTGQTLANSQQEVLTANAYLGAWGIKEALSRGADIVVCPRVTDAAVVIGPAAWHFDWQRDNYDALAGGLAAGHIIECGAQCCGGNYSFFQEVPSYRNVGYPIAEIESDGSFTVTKQPGTGGLVSLGTITAQLLYEVGSSRYMNPDVILNLDTIALTQDGENRVRVSGCRGSSPPETHKVCINTVGPARQIMELEITGIDIERKAEVFLDTMFDNIGGQAQFDDVEVQLHRRDKENPATNEQAQALLRVILTASDPAKLGRLLSAKTTELILANIPGISAPHFSGGTESIVHWPTTIDSRHILESVHIGEETIQVKPTQQLGLPLVEYQKMPVEPVRQSTGPLTTVPLGRIFGTRSGDKGGHANCGVWARSDQAYHYLHDYLTVDALKTLLPDMASYDIDRFEFPNLRAVNFLIRGVLGTGAVSNSRLDRQAKSLGEYLGAKHIEVPEMLLE